MAEAVVSVALETLGDLISEEAKFLGGVSSEVRTLEIQLKEIRSLLRDADRQRQKSNTVRGWIGEIKDLSYRAQDAIELYAVVQGSYRRGDGRLKQLLRRCSSFLKDCSSLHQIGAEISLIKSEIARVTESMKDYGIKSIIEGESDDSPDDTQQWQRRTFPFEIEDVFVGKDQELEKLVSLAVDDEEHRVISVWGMGGIGKTTLVRKVYNHEKAKRFFEAFAWVCISQQCQIRSVLEDVRKQLDPQRSRGDMNSSDTELMGRLCEIQKAKRCMIVIDDIWKIRHWEGLKHAFLLQGTKSKILLTTRKQNVADIGYAFEAGLLSEDDSWELLKKKAFPHTSVPGFRFEENRFEKIGKEIIGKCGKLPLAISLLGGVLSKKKSPREWSLVKENMSEYLHKGEGLENENNGIHRVLMLSYEELPYYLKPCFLYMGRYEEDRLIYANNLCLMWIAQGMISHENQHEEKNLMDIAQEYLSELVSRCLVEIVLGDPTHGQTWRFCKLHDVIRGLSLSMGKEEDFGLQILDYDSGNFSRLLHECLSRAKTRHLFVNFKREIEREQQELTTTCDEDTAKFVRSLHFTCCVDMKPIEFPRSIVDFKKFKLLKVLLFWKIKFERRKLPRGVDNLIHLRDLCLRRCEFDKLPSSISNLEYLHTLDLLHSYSVRIPDDTLNKMFRLKHLFLPRYNVKEMESCYRLSLEGLGELETLSGFNSLVHKLKSITGIKNLRHFEGVIHDNKSLSEIIHAVSTIWKDLRYCGLDIRQDCHPWSSEEDLVNFKKLFTCPNLHELRVHVPIGKLFQDLENHVCTSNLVSLIFEGCEMEEDPMRTLGKLRVLRDLYFRGRSFVGEEMTCGSFDFPRLNELVLRDLPNLRVWRVEQGAMPLVTRIVIRRCPRLEVVPDGFRFLDALRELSIREVPELGKRVCSEGGRDFEKVKHVPSIFIS